MSGPTVIVTGASSGIGAAVAVELARSVHANVVLIARRVDQLETVAEQVREAGGQALAIPCDVSDAAAVQLAVDRTRAEFGAVDIALANAGMTFGFLGARSRRFGTPHNALIWRGLVGCGFVLLWPSFFDLLRYEIFAAMVFLILVGCSLFIFRRRGGELPFKIPGYPWTPLVYIALNAAILGNELWNRPREGTIIIGIVLAGIPVYYLWRAVVLWSERRRPGTE